MPNDAYRAPESGVPTARARGNAAPLVVAHRGGGAIAPENTMAAFRQAVCLGCDAVEVDVLMSRDGHLMAVHDDRLTRVAGLDFAVWDLDASFLQSLDVGSWFGRTGAGQLMPTLEQVGAALPPSMHIVIDLKHDDREFPQLPDRLQAFAQRFGPTRVAFLSIHHRFVQSLADAMPGTLPLYTYRQPVDPDALPDTPWAGLGAGMGALTPRMMAAARERGWPVYLWTPNRDAELEVALHCGVTALITDRPDRALALRSAMG